MKYNSSNKPLVCMQTQSTCYKGTHEMTIKGILLHSTGVNNTALKRYIQPSDKKPVADTYSKTKWLEILGKNVYNNDWNHKAREAGLNGWIGKLADGSIAAVQTMPWNYRPWGCGSGTKGSCNDGWIQFEICEDDLANKTYFNKIYKEACELTAYLCKLYNINPNGTVTHNGVKVPTILCHKDASKLGLGSNHGDVYHWFQKYGKDMTTVRNDVAELIKKAPTSTPATKQVYRVRKAKDDAKSQIGAYSALQNAINTCQSAGAGYHVFDKDFKIVYSYKTTTKATLSSIAVTKLPEKTTYFVGEAYDGAGLEIKATYSDKSVKTITEYTTSGFNSAKAGTTTVSIAFAGKTTSFKLTVKDKPVAVRPDIEDTTNNRAVLIFNCIKKLIQMFAELFSKGEN